MNKRLKTIFICIIVFFTISLINKTFQNDTFFTIPIGKYIIENGIDLEEHFTWHKNLEFNHASIFSVLIAYIYNIFGFYGIYFFVLIISFIIAILIFFIILKNRVDSIIAFILTLISIYLSKNNLCARAQIVSYLIFIIEIYLIEKMLANNKIIYSILLFVLSIILANTHSSVWPMYFILFLPYIVQFLCSYLKLDIFKERFVIEEINIKLLLITFFVSMISGIFTFTNFAPYTDMIRVLKGVSSNYINELCPTNILQNKGMFLILILFFVIAFNKDIKIKLSDFFLLSGLYLMGLIAYRNTIFIYLIGVIPLSRMVNTLLLNNDIFKEIKNNKIIICSFCLCIVMFSLNNLSKNIIQDFVSKKDYPIMAVNYIKTNVSIKEMRIFNELDFGSYLEFNKIPVFIDSRTGIYTKEFNNTTILEDYFAIMVGGKHYNKVFEKYEITHVLLNNNSIINEYIYYDNNYELMYKDDNFSLYKKKYNI